MKKERIQILADHKRINGPVVYWMQREQRVNDNWALIHAQETALKSDSKLIVLFCLLPSFLDATIRQYDFMLAGLKEVEKNLNNKNISFKLLTGNPADEISSFIKKIKAGILITDFNPIKITANWKRSIANEIQIPFHEVDAHNIVPCRIASNKLEYAAYTIRPKINRLLDEYLDNFPAIKNMPADKFEESKINWDSLRDNLKINFNIGPVDWILPGEKAAANMLKSFLSNKLEKYNDDRNDPNRDALSNLSPYLHFGQISAQRIVLAAQNFIEHAESQKSFLEELIIRRELSDNFCHYNKDYDSFNGFHDWAKKTLNEHRNDKREYVYGKGQFENAQTHDDLWNAAQIEMVATGKMHGFMRMYWAKKILEWTSSPEEALEIAIFLNDKYELDGRDPNGYVGCAWSIGGVHDRAWTERPVFGKIRYMNYNGCKRKFDVKAYINKFISADSRQLDLL